MENIQLLTFLYEQPDEYDKEKDKGTSGDELKYGKEWDLNSCKRRKGMHDMEYTAFIFDIVIGFVCGLLGLLHYFGLKKDFINKTGLIVAVLIADNKVFTRVGVSQSRAPIPLLYTKSIGQAQFNS